MTVRNIRHHLRWTALLGVAVLGCDFSVVNPGRTEDGGSCSHRTPSTTGRSSSWPSSTGMRRMPDLQVFCGKEAEQRSA